MSFKAKLKDGSKVIARLPYPLILPKDLGMFSELDTLELLRMHDLPVLKVSGWCASLDNSVGSGFMIMGMVKATDLQKSWESLKTRERMNMVEKIGNLKSYLLHTCLPTGGSISLKDSPPASILAIDIRAHQLKSTPASFCGRPSAENFGVKKMDG